MPFLTSLDIFNRVCQHCGAPKIVTVGEDTVQYNEISFAYDKIRRAELRRNVWRFATRKTVLRPITTTTMLVVPQLWNSSVLYLQGALVEDSSGLIWQNMIPSNIGNTPGATPGIWDQYFGPLVADVFGATSNPPLWVSTTTYALNALVAFNGFAYSSLQNGNTNNNPASSPTWWVSIGSAAQQTYFAGELAYMAGPNPGGYVIFQSLVSNNADIPNIATPWNAGTQYQMDDMVSFSGSQWRSLIAYNIGVTPANAPAAWVSTTTYSTGNTVTGSDGYIYSSVGNGNVGNNPVTDGGVHWTNTNVPAAWSSTPTQYPSDIQWLPIYASLQNLFIQYPVGSGPAEQTTTKNVFRFPANFLREAPQDPKAGSSSFLGAPSGLGYTDYEYESDYIVSQISTNIVYRFVADVVNVQKFDDMFCEGLAARIGMEVVQRITQSGAKKQDIEREYNRHMGEARTVNSIETGATEPPEDDYVMCRM